MTPPVSPGLKKTPVQITLRRAYDAPDPEDGCRVLIDRLWPRGRTKEDLRLDAWLKDVAPSAELRRWFGHDPDKWPEFQRRYRQELTDNPTALAPLLESVQNGPLTLVYGARDEERNNAVVLRDLLAERLETAT